MLINNSTNELANVLLATSVCNLLFKKKGVENEETVKLYKGKNVIWTAAFYFDSFYVINWLI